MKKINPFDAAFNRMRAQLDWLVANAQEQDKVLEFLLQKAEENGGQQREGGNDQRSDGHPEGAGV